MRWLGVLGPLVGPPATAPTPPKNAPQKEAPMLWPNGLRTALTPSRAHDVLAEHSGRPRWRWSHPIRSWQMRNLCVTCLERRPCGQVRWALQVLEEMMGLADVEDLYPDYTPEELAAAGNSGPGWAPAAAMVTRCVECGRVIEWDGEEWIHLWPGANHDPVPLE